MKKKYLVETTGLYKTKDGQTVFISVIDEDSAYGVVENSNFIRIWYISGEYAECAKDTHLDLVEKIKI